MEAKEQMSFERNTEEGSDQTHSKSELANSEKPERVAENLELFSEFCGDGSANNKKKKRKADSYTDEESLDAKIMRYNKLWQAIEVPPGLSKRQRKRYIRNVLWETKWKPLRRAKEREKFKQKKIQAKLENNPLGPSRKMLKQSTMAKSNCKLRIVLDFSFDHLMSGRDVNKCLNQLNSCYSLNRRAANPLQFHVTNFKGVAREKFARSTLYLNWDVNFHEENYMDVFPKDDLVYLTSDSNNVLSVLEDSKVYIIGALVDHNKYKGETLGVAAKQGIKHAQLPIGDFLEMNSRKVLAINHVFQILIHVSEGMSWKDAFLKVIPQRKGAVEKEFPNEVT